MLFRSNEAGMQQYRASYDNYVKTKAAGKIQVRQAAVAAYGPTVCRSVLELAHNLYFTYISNQYYLFYSALVAMITVWNTPGWKDIWQYRSPSKFLNALNPGRLGNTWAAAYPIQLMEGMRGGLELVSEEFLHVKELINRERLQYDQLVVLVIASWVTMLLPLLCIWHCRNHG